MTQPEMMRQKGYCTAAEAAQALGVHLSSIYRAEERGAVKGSQLGRNRYVQIDSLVSYATDKDLSMLSKLDGLRRLVHAVRRSMVEKAARKAK